MFKCELGWVMSDEEKEKAEDALHQRDRLLAKSDADDALLERVQTDNAMLARSVKDLRSSFATQCEVTTARASEAALRGQQLEQVKRYVQDVTLFSDPTLRIELARLLGLDWQDIYRRSRELVVASTEAEPEPWSRP